MSNFSAEQPKQEAWEIYSEFGMFENIGNFDELTIIDQSELIKPTSAFSQWLFENIKDWDYVYCKFAINKYFTTMDKVIRWNRECKINAILQK